MTHFLRAQANLAKRTMASQKPLLELNPYMAKEEELAALINFIASTAANTFPEIDFEDSTFLESFLPLTLIHLTPKLN
ncbi:uncharacterized protein L203_105527 [Cryptococcus depauperatus CBS 7841]|uniref:Uncharacterized protein n=1 Tax=Cryptococcus depauperatus CBS 7841 TaxID=1295531 RepID=A0A1E3ID29_9TREE|nr:hypothetical protein L203_04206 [Cryptococcus depauperatus CBS 7841]